ncbi:MAG: NADP-dependent oxidoreductase [Sphingomonadaceae bacterium]|nr:NADP-dependent oxidoreductase [Sphingomonadaceae bacterium]
MTTATLTRVVLAQHITGAPTPADFRLESVAIPPLADHQFLVANEFVSADPGTRSRLSPGASYAPPLQPGATIDGFSVGRVVESRNDKYPVGTRLTLGAGGWATHSISNGRGYVAALPELGVPATAWLGALGVPGMTAYFGLKRVAEMRAGANVLVTSAAGPVGATAGQLAKHWGAAKVVGLAGGEAGRQWLTDEAGFDAAIDYRAADLDAQLAAAFPEGIDILFDNVGNAMIDRVLPMMRPRGRIIVSGMVADYNRTPAETPGLHNTREFIGRRLRMEGMVVFDDLPAFPAAQAGVAALIRDGKLKTREVIRDGVAALPQLFSELFAPGNADFGRRLVRVGAGA